MWTMRLHRDTRASGPKDLDRPVPWHCSTRMMVSPPDKAPCSILLVEGGFRRQCFPCVLKRVGMRMRCACLW